MIFDRMIEMLEVVEAWPWLVQAGFISSVWLALGLAYAELLFRRPARAHAVIVASGVAGLVMPAGMQLARAQGWGIFAPSEVTQRAFAPPVIDSIPAANLTGEGWWIWALAIVWAGLSGVALVRVGRSYVLARGMARRATPLEDDQLHAAARRAAREMGIAARVELFESDEVRGPVLWAWRGCGRRPTIIVPRGFELESSAALQGVVRHEFAHLARRDHWWRFVMDGLACAFAWNPLAWWGRSLARTMSERACDAWAIEGEWESAPGYARALVSLAPVKNQAIAALGLTSSGRRLETRVRRILDGRACGPRTGRVWALGLLAVMIAALLSGVLARHRAAAIASAGWPEPSIDAAVLLAQARAEGTSVPVRFVPEQLDLGTAPIGGMGVGSAWLVNVGDEAVVLESIDATCGCTTVLGFESGRLGPGEWMELTVTMTAPTGMGEAKRKSVRLSARGLPDVEMPVILEGVSTDGAVASVSSVDWSDDERHESDECPDCGEPLVG